MKAIINGLLYDTDKAKMLLEGIYPLEVGKTYMLPYKTPKGRYFTVETEIKDNSIKESRLTPQTETEIKSMIYGTSVDLYIKIFGEVEDA